MRAGNQDFAITLAQVLVKNSPGSMKMFCKNVIMEMKFFHFSSQYIVVFFPNLVSFSSLVSKRCICSQKEQMTGVSSKQYKHVFLRQNMVHACYAEI